MGVLRAEPTRLQGITSRAGGVSLKAFDLQLTVYALLLAAIGIVMAYSNSAEAGAIILSPGSTFARAILWTILAGVAFALVTAFDYKWLKTFAWPLYFMNLGLLALTLLIGTGVGGTARWIPLLGFQFQFSELAKIIMIVVLARYLSSREARLDSLGTILGACLLVGPPMILVLMQPDLGTSLVFIAILAGMLFMSGASLRWLTLLAAIGIAAVPLVWTYILRDYQKQRLLSFLNPAADPQGSGFQLQQSQIAVGSGGLFGKGLTNSGQGQPGFLPVDATDFVFARLANELGFLFGLVVFALFLLLVWRILIAGWRARDPFGAMFASGVASMVVFQLMVNVGMVLGIMPITGIPLPFVTHGGAALISLGLAIGILQSINIRQSRAEW